MELPTRRARIRLAGLPPSTERTVDFVYHPDFGRYCSDALVAVTRGRRGREIYAAALSVPEHRFAEQMTLDASHIRRFRHLPAEIVAWAERPELDWRGFGLSADPSLWDPDWVQAARAGALPALPTPARRSLLGGALLNETIADLVADRQLAERLGASLARAGHAGREWLRGGCLVFAEGARRALGGTLHGVIDDAACTCGDLDQHGVEHVVLRLPDGRYLDPTGSHADQAALLAAMTALGYRAPTLTPLTVADARFYGIPFDPVLALDLAHRIRLELQAR